jgi:hypothetical protein
LRATPVPPALYLDPFFRFHFHFHFLREFQTKKEVLTGQKKNDILERYGNASTDVPEELLLGQTEARAQCSTAHCPDSPHL